MHPTLLKMARLTMLCGIACLSVFGLSGCMGTRTVYVQPGQPVRIAKPVQAQVYAKDAKGEWVKGSNTITLPEGWYALPDSGDDKK